MKSIVFVASAAAAIAVLSSGCASVPFTNQPDPAVDTARVAQVERAASGRGIGVYWVNLPTRKATAPGDAAVPGSGT